MSLFESCRMLYSEQVLNRSGSHDTTQDAANQVAAVADLNLTNDNLVRFEEK